MPLVADLEQRKPLPPTLRWPRSARPPHVAESGCLGDQYRAGTGYRRDTRVSRGLTLVEGEVADELRPCGGELAPGELRRNINTRGIRLNDLIGSTQNRWWPWTQLPSVAAQAATQSERP